MRYSHSGIANIHTGCICTWYECDESEFLENTKGLRRGDDKSDDAHQTFISGQNLKGLKHGGQYFWIEYSK